MGVKSDSAGRGVGFGGCTGVSVGRNTVWKVSLDGIEGDCSLFLGADFWVRTRRLIISLSFGTAGMAVNCLCGNTGLGVLVFVTRFNEVEVDGAIVFGGKLELT